MYLVLIATVTITVFTVGIYKFDWDNSYSRKLIQLIPFPQALVNSEFIPLNAAELRLSAYKSAILSQSLYDFSTLEGQKNIAEQKHMIANELIREKIIANLLKQNHQEVSNQELNEYYNYLVYKFGKKNPHEEIERTFGLNDEEFRDTIVLPQLREAKLRLSVLDNKNRALDIRSGLTTDNFVKTAKMESDDLDTKYIGGDLGFHYYQELDPWVAAEARNLEVGQISYPIATPEGWRIIMLTAKDEKIHPVKIQLSQIFIKSTDFAKYLDSQKSNFRILVFKNF